MWTGCRGGVGVALMGLLGCGAGAPREGGAGDGAGGGQGDTPADADADGAAQASDAELITGTPLPPGVAPPLRLLDERAVLSGAGKSACSHQEPASGDGHRWCAFRLPGAAPGSTELWVIDVTAAATGALPRCDGSSLSCRRLTTTLWPSYGNDFEGDTLIFYADAPAAPTPGQGFLGPVYGWRPGWSQPRSLASRGLVCNGHPHAAVAVCLDDPAGNPENPDNVVLRVGVLTDTAAGLPALPGRWPLRSDGSVPWQVGFSPDGAVFAVSLPDTVPFVPDVSVIATRDVGVLTPRKVITGALLWTISNDGQKIFFYRGPRTDATLFMANFPGGDGETTLATGVVDYLPIGRGATDTALLLRIKTADGGHAFQLLADRSAPASARTVFTNQGFLEGVLVSTDLRYAAWIDPDFRGSVIRVGDGTSCALNAGAAPPVGDLSFLDDAGLVLWTEPFAGAYARRDGFLSPPDRCAERVRFARGLGFFAPVGHRGLIIGDEKDETSRTVTLKYASLGGAASADAGPVWPSQGPVRIQARVQTPVTFVGTDTLYLLYRAEAQGPRAAGLYLFGPVPF